MRERFMTLETYPRYLKNLPEKIGHLETQFGTDSPIVRVYKRLQELAGCEEPSLEKLETALTRVESEVDEGKFKPQS